MKRARGPARQRSRAGPSTAALEAHSATTTTQNGSTPNPNGSPSITNASNSSSVTIIANTDSTRATTNTQDHTPQGSRGHPRQSSRSRQHPASEQHQQSTAPASAATRGKHSASKPGNQSRRSKFNANLSSNATSLSATSTAFTPTTSAGSGPSMPAPASQTLLERLTVELTSASCECTICYATISRTAPIHSCTTCSTPFHLTCIKEWASRSVTSSAERAQLLASAPNRPSPTSDELAGHWRCPSCQTQFSAEQVPTEYRCFCRRQIHPAAPRAGTGITPHSCGKPCARPRPDGCTHASCGISCHPGPCPPCAVVIALPCHCGQEVKQVRCSSIHGVKGYKPAIAGQTKEELLSCGQTCGKDLGCGVEGHGCPKECHEGPCDPCDVVRTKTCYCGRHAVEEICGDRSRRGERVECSNASNHDDGPWVGEYSCAEVCQAPFGCGAHTCQEPCHPHTSTAPAHCPFSPDVVMTCPCTQTPLSALLAEPRTSCTAPIPTCTLPCPKPLDECGHTCAKPCHQGPCPPCTEIVPLICRCGSLKSSRVCSDNPASPGLGNDDDGAGAGVHEFTCSRACKALLACGRHVCGRQCCPLQYQEAFQQKAKKGHNKQRGRTVAEEQWQSEVEDPMGLHQCQRTCGRKLNCGLHNCERNDHKGPCPPCLRADFDELVCHCGSTVVLPPIPCNYTIDCRHPCIRPSECGHQQMPHACHENPPCPPCPFLIEKPCACGKKMVGNVRCSMDQKKVSCGTTCGRLLKCGGHRCTKPCHLPGECESCTQICLKPRRGCQHPCPERCHAPTPCPTMQPCPKLITVTCACGHLQQAAKCGACDAKPEGNQGRLLKCSDACAIAKRNQQLAEALGIEKHEVKVKQVEYDPLLMNFYQANIAWCNQIEAQLTEFVKSDPPKPSLHFPVMKRPQRAFVHELTDYFDIRSESLDEEPRRSVVVHRQSKTGVPEPTLAEHLAAQRKLASSSSATLNLGSLRKALVPERKAVNAVLLEQVLGLDEAMLKDVLRPLMRGLVFAVTWVGDENVLVTFDTSTYSSPAELESKLQPIQHSLRTLTEETGFCASVELVTLGDDGKVVRGAWTPVGSGSRSYNGGAGGHGSGTQFKASAPMYTTNSFASLGGSSTTPVVRNAWAGQQPGSVVGPAAFKPPRAVVGTVSSVERPAVSVPSLAKKQLAPPAPPAARVQNDEDVPESWDANDEDGDEAGGQANVER